MFNKLVNPLLFYHDSEGRTIFKNFCLIHNDGYGYLKTYTLQEAGKALEYRLELNKLLNYVVILITLLCYFIFIHTGLALKNLLWCEFIWCILYFGFRYFCAEKYAKFMQNNYGEYNITNFAPPLNKDKQKAYLKGFLTKIALILTLLIIFSAPAFLMQYFIKHIITTQKPHFKIAIYISKIYSVFYPKTPKIYDMTAYAKYMAKDYEGSLKDYEHIFTITGKKFSQKDFNRFNNYLYLQKKLYGTQQAIDAFNDFATRKKMSTLQASQMLWIKSIFAIGSNAFDSVLSDYDDLIASLNKKDAKNKFYIMTDKAYMMYLMRDYRNAIAVYNSLINYAKDNYETFGKELPHLYAERGYIKRQVGDNIGADDDFVESKINVYELKKFKPTIPKQGFIVEEF